MVIPERWSKKQLCDVVSMKSGDTITAERISDNEKYPCYGGNGLRGYTDRYTHDGEYALIGRQGALCGNVNYAKGKFYASEHAVVVTPHVDTDIRFMYYLLTAMNLNQYSTSSAQPGLAVNKILELECVLPDNKSEQIAVAIALSDIDKTISTQEKLIAKKQAVKQGTVQELLSGKKRLLGFTEKWAKCRLGDVGTLLRMSVNPQQHPHDKFYEYSMPSYDDGRKPKFVNGEAMNSLRYKIPHNILLFNKLNVRQKRVWLIEEELPNSVCSTEFLPYQANGIDLYLLREILIQNEVVNYFDSISTGTSNSQKRISPQNFLDYEVFMPLEIEEQRALSLLLKDMNEEIDVLKGKLRKLHQIKTGMMDNLLTGKIRLIE